MVIMKAKWSDITGSQQWAVLNPSEKRIIIEEYSQTLPENHRDIFKRGAELDVFTPAQLEAAGITEVTPDVRLKFAESSRNVDKNIAAYDRQQDKDWFSKRNVAGYARAIGEGLTLGGFDETYAALYPSLNTLFPDKTWLAGVARDRGEGLTRGGFDELYSTIKPKPILLKPLISYKTLPEAYEEAKEGYKEAKEAGEKFHKAHPIVDTALQIGGGIGGAVLAPGMYVGKTALGTVGRNVGMGALAGALSGEGLEGRALSTVIGAGVGGVIPGSAIGLGKVRDAIGTKIIKGQYPELHKALTGGLTNKNPKLIKTATGEPVPDVLNALMGGKTYSQQERLGNEMVKAARKNPGLYNATKASVDANVDTPFKDQVVNELNSISKSSENKVVNELGRILKSGVSKKDGALIRKASDRIAKGLRAIDTDDVAENAINKENIIALIDDNIASLQGKISNKAYKEVKDRLFDLGMQRRVANRMVKVTAPQEKSLLSSLAGFAGATGAGALAGSVLGGVPAVGALLGALGREALTGSATKRIVQEATKSTLSKTLKEGMREAGKKSLMGKAASVSKKDLKALDKAAEYMGYGTKADNILDALTNKVFFNMTPEQRSKVYPLSIINALRLQYKNNQ